MFLSKQPVQILLLINESLAVFLQALHILVPLCKAFPFANFSVVCPNKLCKYICEKELEITNSSQCFKLDFSKNRIHDDKNEQKIYFKNDLSQLPLESFFLAINIETNLLIKKKYIKNYLKINTSKQNLPIIAPYKNYFKALKKIGLHYEQKQQITLTNTTHSNIQSETSNDIDLPLMINALNEDNFHLFKKSPHIISNNEDIILLSQLYVKQLSFAEPINLNIFYTFANSNQLSLYNETNTKHRFINVKTKNYLKKHLDIFVDKKDSSFKKTLLKAHWQCTSNKYEANVIILKYSFKNFFYKTYYRFFFSKTPLIIAENNFDLNLKLETFLSD